ncbi:MAG: glucosamine-6-phosphate deaminase [Eubacteriales bacterium]|nr:glucosamine-6-phosphate deaminase [Clostridiales bacterium]MDY3286202.1 glucosamine-6-phosphate deaminase [Eubacteriales bacterium]MDY5015456.1 glucosamine-6-phosphate deaminase [Eubacteriales bacterium]
MKLIAAKDYDQMSQIAARYFAAQVLLKPTSVFGFATGSTPIGLYKELIRKNAEGKITFKYAHTVNLDEYYGMPRDHEQSYYSFMHANLFDHIDIDPANTRLPNGMAEDADAECRAYDEHIASLGGVDMQLLGIGHDGHIGFNEPSDHFSLGTNCVTLTEMTIEANKRFFASANDVPRKALTMGMREIMQAKKIVMVVNGKDKAQILYDSFCGPITPAVPASILQLHPDVTLVADEAALSVMKEHCKCCKCCK